MDAVPILGRDQEDRVLNPFLAHYDAPAYVRRARQVQDSLEQLLGTCRSQREEWLTLVRIRLGTLRALAGSWERMLPLLREPADLSVLQQLWDELQPKLRLPIEPTSSIRRLRRELQDLCASLDRFNQQWTAFLPSVDLSRVNVLREAYNRYYLLEKECAVRSPALARRGFRRLEPLTSADLLSWLPPLPVPRT